MINKNLSYSHKKKKKKKLILLKVYMFEQMSHFERFSPTFDKKNPYSLFFCDMWVMAS